jgi:hypothetical protein
MSLLLFIAIFLAQGAASTGSATLTGVVRDTAGKPLARLRVAAMSPPEIAGGTGALLSIGLTDETGRYKLEVPAGRYYIVAGRVDKPTYYPGASGPEGAVMVSIAAGSATNSLDFVVSAITGIVRDLAGKPLAGMRVVAMEASNASVLNDGPAPSMIIGNTDPTGHYRLEVPPGRYYISAGRAGRSIFYPGATDLTDAASILVGSGNSSDALDFALPEESPRSRAEDLYLQGLEGVELGRYAASRLLFQTLITTFPDSEFAPQARYAMAASYYREGTPAAMMDAQKLLEEYLRLFPNTPLAVEARHLLTEIQRKSGR